jgi:hypothetical protein
MGNTNTKQLNTEKSKLEDLIDNIASNFITKQNFKDMENLSNEEYCNKLVLLTSKVLQKLLKKSDIDYLEQKTRYGVEINKMNKDVIFDMNIKELKENMITNKVNKRRVCIGIAKYYVQVAQLFSAIVSTLNPEYIFVDKNGVKKKTTLFNKHLIPKNSSISVERVNLCNDRVNALHNDKINNTVINNNEVILTPNVCSLNLNKRSLTDEIGIPELEKLYYDKYNYNTGSFDGMSEKMKKIYNDDLNFLYKAFTGKDIPKVNNETSIKKFSQIPLKAYHTSKNCSENGMYKKKIKISLKNNLFIKYSDNIKDILTVTKINQDKLINILNTLFIVKGDDIKLNKNIDSVKLQNLINESREIIKNLYIECENKFTNGIKILDSIIEKQILDTTREQVSNLSKLKLTNEYNMGESKKDIIDKEIIVEEKIKKERELNELKREREREREREEKLKKEKELNELMREREKEEKLKKEKELNELMREREKEEKLKKEKELNELIREREEKLKKEKELNELIREREEKLKKEKELNELMRKKEEEEKL